MVTISRTKGSLTFSVNFQLIAAMNPCPYGLSGESVKLCTCDKIPETDLWSFRDRIDIHIEIPRVDYDKLSGDRLGESSEAIRSAQHAYNSLFSSLTSCLEKIFILTPIPDFIRYSHFVFSLFQFETERIK
jgi:Magnesium chelatase, subunit ChlI